VPGGEQHDGRVGAVAEAAQKWAKVTLVKTLAVVAESDHRDRHGKSFLDHELSVFSLLMELSRSLPIFLFLSQSLVVPSEPRTQKC
jgi:hypothetical protein